MNRKGSAIVEAAVVFPVVLFTLLGLIGILMFLQEDAAAQSILHQTIRYEAGRETGTYIGEDGSTLVACTSGFEGVARTIRGEVAMTFDGSPMGLRSLEKTQTARLYLTDERKYARIVDFFTVEESNGNEAAHKPGQ